MGKKSTSTQSNEPPSWAQPLFVKSAKEAERLFDKGSGFDVYQGQTTAPLSQLTQQGLSQLSEVSRDPNLQQASSGAVSSINDVLGAGGYNQDTQAAANYFGNTLAGGENIDTSGIAGINAANAPLMGATAGFGNAAAGGLNTQTQGLFGGMLGQSTNPLASEQNLGGIAAGDHLGGNTYERDAIRNMATDLADQTSQQFSGAGRYGSGAHQDTLIDSTGDFLNKAFGDQFNRDRGYQMQANQMLDAAQGQRFGQGLDSIRGILAGDQANAGIQLQGASGLLGAGSQLFGNQMDKEKTLFGALGSNADRRMAGAGALQGAGQSALDTQSNYISQLPTAMSSSLFAPTAALQGGAIRDQYNQSNVNDRIRRFYENNMQDWTRLGALQAAAGGAAGPYGTSTTTQKQPFNPLGAIGGLLSMF